MTPAPSAAGLETAELRERFTVTITDFRGSRHFSLNQVVKHFALGGVVLLAVVLVTGGGAIYWLNGEIDGLNQRRDEVQREHDRLQEEKQELLAAVEDRNRDLIEASQELSQVTEQLGEIEILVGVREPTGDAGQDIHHRLDTAAQTAREKMLILQQVPNGYPVTGRSISSGYGWRKHPITGEKSHHNGVDLRGTRGDSVVATADGVVEWAAFHKSSGLGKLVILRHDYGFRTYYGHLDDVTVGIGDFVEKGQEVGKLGSTGLSSGPHLHYEVRHIYRKLQPKPFLVWGLDNYDSLFQQEDRVKWDSLAKAVKRRLDITGPQLSLRGPASPAN